MHGGSSDSPAVAAPLLTEGEPGRGHPIALGDGIADDGKGILVTWWRSLTLEHSRVGLVFGLFVTMRAMDRVFNKRVNDRMVNYQMSYVNFLWPIGVQIMT